MWSKIRKIFSRNAPNQLTLPELAKDLCLATFFELGAISGANNKIFNTSSEMKSNCFLELLAYYQFLVLIYLANVLDLTDTSLDLYGGDLNVVCCQMANQIANYDVELDLLIEGTIRDNQFQNLVSAYLAGDKSISGLSDESFFSLLKFLGFEKYYDDLIMMSYVVSYSRILKVLGVECHDIVDKKMCHDIVDFVL
ncbi:MAG: hypothetical protein COZ68_05780 [Deltaproteobacteria bacterium CG_4_8_14_3_um_filter_43_13]